MRFPFALAIGSLAILGSAVAVPRQDEPLAEATFKNITSLKGTNASDVIPAMEFMSASLGVGCDYCHTEDRASDAKEEKQSARAMIAMQKDINARNFRGRNQVTCASCHAGHTHPVSVPPVEGAQVRARRSADVQPAAVLAAYDKAVGANAADVLRGLKLTGSNVNKGEKGKVDAIYSGERFTYATHGAKVDSKLGFNGNVAWFSTPQGIKQVPLVYAIQFLRQYSIFAGTASLPKLTNPSGATTKIGDKDMLVVNGTIEGSKTRATLYFDKKSGLLARTLFGYQTVLGAMVQTNDYSEYRKVSGVQLPMMIVSHTSEGDIVTKYSSAKTDANLDQKIFDPAK